MQSLSSRRLQSGKNMDIKKPTLNKYIIINANKKYMEDTGAFSVLEGDVYTETWSQSSPGKNGE